MVICANPAFTSPTSCTMLGAERAKAFGDPHQLGKTGLTPTSALVKLPTRRDRPFSIQEPAHEESPSRLR